MFYLVKKFITNILKVKIFYLAVFLIFINLNLISFATVNATSIKEIKKISDLINLAKGEYKESVKNNQVTPGPEYKEANLFMQEAHKNLKSLESKVSREKLTGVKEKINLIDQTIKAKNKPEIMVSQVEEADKALEILSGNSLKEFPSLAPSLDNGRKVFEQNCAVCHGMKGFGDGPASGALQPKPANFHDKEFIRETPPYAFYRTIKNGVTGTAMPAWDYQLSLQDKWDVIKYVRNFSGDESSMQKGKAIYKDKFLKNNDANLMQMNDIRFSSDKSDLVMIKLLKSTDKFTGLNEEDLASLVNFIRNEKTVYQASGTGNELTKKEYLAQTTNEIKRLLYLSRKKYLEKNKNEAVDNAITSYLTFEPLEKELGAKNKVLSRKLELDFNSLKGLYASDADTAKIDSLIGTIEQELVEATTTLDEEKDGIALLLQSMFLIMREGFEAIIIIMALITFIKKASPGSKLINNMYYGVGLGILASFITAVILESVLRHASFSKEFLEGITVLTAAAILFYVSHWLISKTQANQWQTFIRSTLSSALSNKNQAAIVSVGFLSVYREGFECILFYKALYTTSSSDQMITLGLLLGCMGLTVISVLFYKFSVKIPIKEFFLVTGLLLYYMVFSFVGKGLHELQEGNLISITGISHVPEIDLIGIYPTLETTVAQVFVLLAWIGAVSYTFYAKPKRDKIIEKHVG